MTARDDVLASISHLTETGAAHLHLGTDVSWIADLSGSCF